MSAPAVHRFEHHAMATLFEVYVPADQDADYARQACQELFGEIDRMERLLSHFDPQSDVGQINLLLPGQSVRVGIETFECLRLAEDLYAKTNGAFDVTVGPLVACCRTEEGDPRQPDPEELAALRDRVGMNRLRLREEPEGNDRSVPKAFVVELRADVGPDGVGVRVDLGGVGKGYALDRLTEIVEEWEIGAALIHGGTSTALAVGAAGDEDGWPVGVGGDWTAQAEEDLSQIVLKDAALSGSGPEVKGCHIIDPRTGAPVEGRLGAWANCPSAAVADALSTAFMVMSTDEIETYCQDNSDTSALVVSQPPEGDEPTLTYFGAWRRQ